MSGGKKGEKALNLGARVKYPITITKLYKKPGDTIRKQEPLLQYSFEYNMELPNNRATLEYQTKKLTSITDWNAPENGKLLAWQVRVGEVVARDRACVTVEEACTHEIQFQGLCALCGRDMNEVNWASEHRDTERAPINMTHDQTNLTVSRQAATRAEHELQRRLLSQRKLSLVVDLDQTIIHACIDPTIGEWQQDASNPNYEALKDVRRFQLDEGYSGLARGCWYYIKMRPGLSAFLDKITEMYELHVYTMGTRTYATNIAQIVDPDQKRFGNRVISRDENGNIVSKSLQRLFPVSTNMAVIMDDRADVWPHNRHNLIKVVPYDFFKGTGDINSSFLPKRSDLSTTTSKDAAVAEASGAVAAAAATSKEGAAPSASPLESPVAVAADDSKAVPSPASSAASAAVSAPGAPNGGTASQPSANGAPKASPLEDGEDAILQQQAEEQERTIEKQIKDRPLLHMQEQLDKEDEEAAAAAVPKDAKQSVEELRPRHCVLYDDDKELQYLEHHLTRLHHDFYEAYDATHNGTAATSNHSNGGGGSGSIDTTAVPDVGEVLDRLKDEVLRGTSIVLSGLVPLGHEVERSEIGLQAMSFGARLQRQISPKVTHLVISSDRPRTQKVRQAARIPSIKIVNQHWLADCFSQWTHVDETPYLVDVHPADRERSVTAGTQGEVTDSETLSDQESDHENAKPRIVITNNGTRSSSDSGAPSQGNDDEFKEFNDSDAMSPIEELKTFDWGSADDELEMFLAEGDDDDDGEDATDYGDDEDDGNETESAIVSSPSKRKLDEDTDTDNEQPSRGRSLFAKRQKLGGVSRSRSTSKLRTAVVMSSDANKDTNGTAVAVSSKLTETPASVDIDEDQLEAMLMAELDEDEGSGEGDG